MASAIKPPAAKLAKLDGANEDGEGGKELGKAATEEEHMQLEKVVSIQNEIDQLNERASEEILHVEQKYNKLRQPHYQERSEILATIPDFWHTTLVNNSQFADLLSGEDETALQYLSNLTVEEFDGPSPKSGYKIFFHFRTNPFFDNDVLSKEVLMDDSGETTVTGTAIEWKEDKDLTIRQSGDTDGIGNKRALEELPSFFSWFSTESEEPGEIIRDYIWPNPLQFYLNTEAGLNETFDDEDDEDEDGLDEEDDEDDEDQDVIDLSDDDDEV